MGYHDETKIGGPGEGFLTTHWSLVDRAKRGEDRDRSLIGQLLQRYWKPVYCFLRQKGYSNEEAKDLTQGFFHEVVLNRNLVTRANPAQGHFRSFLLHALDQYLIDCHRKAEARKRIPREKIVSLEMVDLPAAPHVTSQASPEDSFNYSWKAAILDQTLTTTRKDCHEQGLQVHWRIFDERVLRPIFQNLPATSMKEICARHGIESESLASNMLVTVKRRFKAVLRKNLRHTVLTETDVDGELKQMLGFFGNPAQERSQGPG